MITNTEQQINYAQLASNVLQEATKDMATKDARAFLVEISLLADEELDLIDYGRPH